MMLSLRLLSETPSQPIRASYYADGFQGRKMANGHPFNNRMLTAASKVYPLGTWVLVTSTITGHSVSVLITDRGPWGTRYQLDLSQAAFAALGIPKSAGWAWVVVSPENFHTGDR